MSNFISPLFEANEEREEIKSVLLRRGVEAMR